MEIQIKKCLSCGKPVKGRSDKKFCDDYCRNQFNNQAKGVDDTIIRNINNQLKKNRNILASLIADGNETTKTTKEKLMNMGFQFKWHTHQYKTQKGATYLFCYDFGYLAMDNDWFLIVRDKEQKKI